MGALDTHAAINEESQQGIAELLKTAQALGEDGAMLMQDIIASLLMHRRSILADAEFMSMLTQQSPETLRTLMAALLDCSDINIGTVRRRHQNGKLAPISHRKPKSWTARGSDIRPRSRSR